MRKQKKMKAPGPGDGFKEAMLPMVMSAAVIIIFIVVASVCVKAFLYRSDYFRLRAVETKAAFLDQRISLMISNQVLSAHKARNVFKINLKYIAQSIQGLYGDVKDVVVRIALPDKLIVTLKLRKPVALVRNAKYYPIDEEGVVLPGMGRVEALKDLPIIEGVDMRYVSRRGAPVNLKLALELLKDIKAARFMNAYGIATITASDPGNLLFYLKNGVEIRMGGENFGERLEMLGKTLRDPRLVLDKIKYIDVRFKDVYIGPK